MEKSMDKTHQIQVGDRIREVREQANLTQAQMAEHLGISQNHLSCLERGIYSIKAEDLIGISEAVGVSIEYLWYGETASEDSLNPRLKKKIQRIYQMNEKEQDQINLLLESVMQLMDK